MKQLFIYAHTANKLLNLLQAYRPEPDPRTFASNWSTNDGSSSKKRKLDLIFHFVNIFYIYIMIIKEEEKNKSTFQFPKDLHFFLERIFCFSNYPSFVSYFPVLRYILVKLLLDFKEL